MKRFLHNLTHWHYMASKEDVGQFILCGPRWSRDGELMFRPDVDGAGWHPVPDVDMNDLFAAPDWATAMAMIRAAE